MLVSLFQARNPKVDVWLDSTWSRADLTYQPAGHWYGRPIDAMEKDVRVGYDKAAAATPGVHGVLTADEMAVLRPVNASLGLMLETTSERLGERGQPHHRALKIDRVVVTRRRDGHFREKEIPCGEPGFQPLHAIETSHEQPGRRQDGHGDRDLPHDQGVSQPVSTAAGSGAIRASQRLGWLDPRRL